MNLIVLALFAILLRNFTDATPISIDVNLLQNLPLTLSAIQEKLTNLENLLTIQCNVRINEKLDHYADKMNNIEKTISKLEVESFYETINHKLTALQEQVDSFKSDIKNTEEVVTTKLDKIEENLTIRDSDIEGELNEAIATIDDLKITSSQIEENATSQIKTYTEKISKHTEEFDKYYRQLQVDTNNITEKIDNVQEILHLLHNQTLSNAEDVAVVKVSVNSYANKLLDTHSELQQKVNSLDTKLQRVAVVTNLSRSELQNNLRSLMVQLGRLTGKPHIQDYNNKLDELNKKLDTNFQNILLSQNFFLESCHRVQMDEEQIESQISIVLNKLLDIFENNTSNSVNDMKNGNELQNVLQEIANSFDDQKHELGKVYTSLQELVSYKNPILLETILKVNQDLQKIIEKPSQNDLNLSDNILSILNIIEAKIDNREVKYNINDTKQQDVEKWSFNGETESRHLFELGNLNVKNCIQMFNSTYIIAGAKGNDYTVVICPPHYADSIGNCTIMKSSEKECLPNYINLINNQFSREEFIKCASNRDVKKVRATTPSNLQGFEPTRNS